MTSTEEGLAMSKTMTEDGPLKLVFEPFKDLQSKVLAFGLNTRLRKGNSKLLLLFLFLALGTTFLPSTSCFQPGLFCRILHRLH